MYVPNGEALAGAPKYQKPAALPGYRRDRTGGPSEADLPVGMVDLGRPVPAPQQAEADQRRAQNAQRRWFRHTRSVDDRTMREPRGSMVTLKLAKGPAARVVMNSDTGNRMDSCRTRHRKCRR